MKDDTEEEAELSADTSSRAFSLLHFFPCFILPSCSPAARRPSCSCLVRETKFSLHCSILYFQRIYRATGAEIGLWGLILTLVLRTSNHQLGVYRDQLTSQSISFPR